MLSSQYIAYSIYSLQCIFRICFSALWILEGNDWLIQSLPFHNYAGDEKKVHFVSSKDAIWTLKCSNFLYLVNLSTYIKRFSFKLCSQRNACSIFVYKVLSNIYKGLFPYSTYSGTFIQKFHTGKQLQLI